MPSAYDPVRGEDVHFDRCHPVHAAEDADDLGEHVVKIVSRDFKHDPCEGCQGGYSLIIKEDCPECGCNRARKGRQTLAGITSVTCVACDHMLVAP